MTHTLRYGARAIEAALIRADTRGLSVSRMTDAPGTVAGLLAQGKVSLPVASSVPSHGRDEMFFNWNVSPARRAGRRHRQKTNDR